MTRPAWHQHCHSCGTAYPQVETYPRRCASCSMMVWMNPTPVSVLLVPVKHGERVGLLTIRRAIEPRKDLLALVGGFLEAHESWQLGGAREVVEETGVVVDEASVEPFWFTSTEPRPNRVLLFGTVDEVNSEDFTAFVASPETSARGVVFGPDGLEEVFAFPLHIEAARRWFEARGLAGAHDFTEL